MAAKKRRKQSFTPLSMASRFTTVLTLGIVLLLIAVAVWAYQTDRLTGSADVRVVENRVHLNFDELPIQGTNNGPLPIEVNSQYVDYGITFGKPNTESESFRVAATHFPRSGLSIFSLFAPSQPTAIAGATWNGYVWHPNELTRPVIMNFHEPGDADTAETTDYVKFKMPTNNRDNEIPGNFGGNHIARDGFIQVLAKDENGAELVVQEYKEDRVETVELEYEGIAVVEIESSGANWGWGASQNLVGPKPQFLVDDLQFTMPGSDDPTEPGRLVLTSQQQEYELGETVQFTYTNVGQGNAECRSPVALAIEGTERDGDAVFPPKVLYQQAAGTTVDLVAPGNQRSTSWDQTVNTEQQKRAAIAGTFTATITCGDLESSADFSIRADEEPPPVVVPQGTLTLSKQTYEFGETVNFTLENTGDVAIECPSSAPFKIQDSQGTDVYNPIGLTVIETIGVGASESWSWEQIDNNEAQVNAGAYRVLVTCDQVQESAAFTIAEEAQDPPPPIPFGLTVEPTEGQVPLGVTASLDLDEDIDYDGELSPLLWDFGDGTTYANAPIAQGHTYTEPGTYTVTLRVGDGRSTSGGPVTVTEADTGGQGGGDDTGSPPSSTTQAGDDDTTTPGPIITQAPKSSTAPATLVSTGGNLVVNVLIALLLTGGFGYFFLRKHPEQI